MMEYMTTKEAAGLWGISVRRVQIHCENGRVEGAQKLADMWIIPKGAAKPVDGRVNSGRRKQGN